MNVVIIIPTYNEKGNIGNLVNVLEKEVFPTIKNHKMGILVVDDNSPDGTADVVKKLMTEWKNIELCSGEKQGLGAAYVRGMNYAVEKMNAEVMFEIDADGQHDPKKIPDFLKKIDEGYDMVIGTRYSKGGSIPKNWPPQRKAFSVIGNILVRTILMRFSIHDWTGGYRALRKEVFLKEKEELTSFKGYTFQVSFLNKAVRDNFKIAEVPFHFTDRTLGDSKIAPKEYIIDLLKYVISDKFKELVTGTFGKFLAVGLSGLIINTVIYVLLAKFTNLSLVYANTIGAELAIFSNYNLNNFWTFKERKTKTVLDYFWKLIQFFVTSSIGVFIFQNGSIKIGSVLYGRKFYLIYYIIGTAMLLMWNFIMYSVVIWKKKK